LAAPDPSRNYNEAREKHQENTGFWFINSPQFAEWKMKPDILLWVRGMRKFSDRFHEPGVVLTFNEYSGVWQNHFVVSIFKYSESM
jgi:hypothetical protein